VGGCFAAIAALRGAAEVVIVLDGPAPSIEPLLRRHLPVARVVRRRDRQGFATAATAGLRAAKGALVTLLNDDAVPDPGWLDALEDAARRHPDAASFASLVLQERDPSLIDSAGHGLTRWGEPFDIGHGARVGPPFTVERPVLGPSASAAAYRRELLRPCGGFDAGYGAYLEDVDLSLRAALSGHPCVLVPAARVVHRGSASYDRRGAGGAERLLYRNRIRLLARAMPRHLLAQGLPIMVFHLAVEAMAATARGENAGAVARGLRDGLRELPLTVRDRPAALGGRCLDDDAVDALLRQSERHLAETLAAVPGGVPRRVRAGLTRLWAAGLDAWPPLPPPWA
jgi:GT2 family glycosyltransferase